MATADNITVKIEVKARDLVEACIKALTEDGTLVEVVRCKDCKHRPSGDEWNHDIEFPDDLCPCQCEEDFWYSWIPKDDWFCGNGERRTDE